MRLISVQTTLLGACLAIFPMAASAQDPSMPTMPTNQPGSSSPLPGSTNSQKQPGVTHSNGSVFGQDTSANEAGGPDVTAMRDKIFLRKATQGGLAEVQLGQLAAQKASNDDVKKFGQKMVDDHTVLNDVMKPIASSMGIMPPIRMSKADQAEYDKLNGLTGTDFDKEYLSYMIQDHRRDLKDFHDESQVASDPALKDATTNGTKVIGQHTRMVVKLAEANGVPVPPRPNQ